MHRALESLLNRTWYGERSPGRFLLVLEKIYKVLAPLHRRYGRMRLAKDLRGFPILVVGNLTVGGAGKTPMVIRLCELARQCGLNPGVASRGYGRMSRGPISVNAAMDSSESGDEPLLIALRCGVPVQVDANREEAVRELFRQKASLVIADDGLQRTRLPRQLEICLVDNVRGFGNGRQLPAGPLREPVSRLEHVDFAVEHLASARHPAADSGFSMYLRPGTLQQLHGDQSMALEELAKGGQPVHALAPWRDWWTGRTFPGAATP